MDIIANLMTQSSPPIVQFIFVLGLYTLIVIMYNLGSIVYNVLRSLGSAISITRCAMISAKQKAVATNTIYVATCKTMFCFLWKNFILHLSSDGDVEYDSPDFRWESMFNYDTYNTHVRSKSVQDEQ